jgi:hypothetical protein
MDVAGTVGEEDVQRLGRPDAVEDLHTEPLGEPLLQRCRQRLTGRGRQSHRRERVVGDVAGEQGGVERRHAVEQRRLVSLYPLADHVRGGPARVEDRRGTHREREEHRVPDPVGEEELGDREAGVLGGDPQHLVAVGLADVADVGVPVHGRLRRTGGAGGVEPQRPRVLVGDRGGALLLGGLLGQGVEVLPGVRRRAGRRGQRTVPVEHRELDLGSGLEGGADRVGELVGGHDQTGAGVGQDLTDLRAGEHRGDRDGDQAGPEGAEDAGEQLHVVGGDEHDPVVAAQAEPAVGRCQLTGQRGQLGVRQGPRAPDGDPVPCPVLAVPVDQVGEGVEIVCHGDQTRVMS